MPRPRACICRHRVHRENQRPPAARSLDCYVHAVGAWFHKPERRRVKVGFAANESGFVRWWGALAPGFREHRQDRDALHRLARHAHRDLGESGHNLRGTNDGADKILPGPAFEEDVRAADMRLRCKAERKNAERESGPHRLSRNR